MASLDNGHLCAYLPVNDPLYRDTARQVPLVIYFKRDNEDDLSLEVSVEKDDEGKQYFRIEQTKVQVIC